MGSVSRSNSCIQLSQTNLLIITICIANNWVGTLWSIIPLGISFTRHITQHNDSGFPTCSRFSAVFLQSLFYYLQKYEKSRSIENAL